MSYGKFEFQEIYKNHKKYTTDWSRMHLYNEQRDPVLQKIHEKHYQTWNIISKMAADWKVRGKFLFFKSG